MKSVKLYWNGKRMKDVYPFATRFEVIKYKIGKFAAKLIKTSLVVALALGSLWGSFKVGQSNTPETEALILDTLTPRVEELKAGLVKKLSDECEVKNVPESEKDGWITFDPNKSGTAEPASIGRWQFKVKTIQWYYKKLYGKELSRDEAIRLAMSKEKAGELATRIIFEEPDGIQNWYNCNIKLNLKQEIIFIKSL